LFFTVFVLFAGSGLRGVLLVSSQSVATNLHPTLPLLFTPLAQPSAQGIKNS